MASIDAKWLKSPETQLVFSTLLDAGFQAFAVGGCVRDSVLARPISDIDIATDAPPAIVIDLANEAGFRAVPTGVDHGTVTIILRQASFEITTFRRDVETDGRRAKIEFSDTLDEDAQRRDFTMNALYADRTGTVHDPVGGLRDLAAGRVKFIGSAELRIREDYLRSLRFFRFHAWYGNTLGGFDADAIAAIASNLDGIDTLSKERIGGEVLKLMLAPDPAPAVAAMRSTGVLSKILPGADDQPLAPLIDLERELGLKPKTSRRLSALGGENIKNRLRLSRKLAEQIRRTRTAMSLSQSERAYRFGYSVALDATVIMAATQGLCVSETEIERLKVAADQTFPISAGDLMPRYSGHTLGAKLKHLERLWIESGFSLSKTALLEMLDEGG